MEEAMAHLESRTSQRPRPVACLPEKLEKNLLAYAVAAAAAGVGLLGVTQLAEAEVVYTPKYITLGHACNECGPASYPIDLNNDGKADLSLVSFFGVTSFLGNGATLEVYPCCCKTPNSEVGDGAIRNSEQVRWSGTLSAPSVKTSSS